MPKEDLPQGLLVPQKPIKCVHRHLVKGSVGWGEDGVVGVGLLQGRDQVCRLQGCVQCREMLVLLQSLGETLSSGH